MSSSDSDSSFFSSFFGSGLFLTGDESTVEAAAGAAGAKTAALPPLVGTDANFLLPVLK